jgi:hypothetical protein
MTEALQYPTDEQQEAICALGRALDAPDFFMKFWDERICLPVTLIATDARTSSIGSFVRTLEAAPLGGANAPSVAPWVLRLFFVRVVET